MSMSISWVGDWTVSPLCNKEARQLIFEQNPNEFYFSIEITDIYKYFDTSLPYLIENRFGPYKTFDEARRDSEKKLSEWVIGEYKKIKVLFFVFCEKPHVFDFDFIRECLDFPFCIKIILSVKSLDSEILDAISIFDEDDVLIINKDIKKSDVVKNVVLNSIDKNQISVIGFLGLDGKYNHLDLESMIIECARNNGDAIFGVRFFQINQMYFFEWIKNFLYRKSNKSNLIDPLGKLRFYKFIPFFRIINQLPSTNSIEWHLNKLLPNIEVIEKKILVGSIKK